MLYCPKCQVLTNDKTCPSCGGKKLRVPEPEDPALLITAGDEPENKEMSPRKQFLWRAASVVLFILVVWGVVVAADYAANALKAFLTHG